MNKLFKSVLLFVSVASITLVSARDITDLPNYQIKLSPSSETVGVLAKQSNEATQVGQVDKYLGVLPFEWAKSAQTQSSLNNSDALTIANTFVATKYSNALVASGSEINSFKTSSKRNIIKLRYLSEMSNGVKIAKYTQSIDGFDVHAREFNVLLDADNQIVASSGYLAETLPSKLESTASVFKVKERIAIEHAFADVMGDKHAIALKDKTPQQTVNKVFDAQHSVAAINLQNDIRIKKVWFDQRSQLIPAYYIELLGDDNSSKQQFAYGHVISADSGEMLSRNNLVSRESFTYRVFNQGRADGKLLDGPQGHELPIIAGSPQEAQAGVNRQLANTDYSLVTLESGPISTGDPWLPASATTTNGNNVHAYLDLDGVNGFQNGGGDLIAETTSARTFDYAFDPNATLNADVRKSAVVNLFYMNNWLHDWFYDSGFDEVSGNAQANNLGRGGNGGDVLLAEGQDSSGRNNANMATPSDGGSPRMQMFLFDGSGTGAQSLDLSNVPGFANPTIGVAGFGPKSFTNVTAEVIAYVDATAAPSLTDACEPPSNAANLVGKIALIDRGDCNFTVKVKNAQDAGAIAVLIANNVDANQVITMGGADVTINIPSFMVTQNAGAAIRESLAVPNNVTATLNREGLPDLDGTYDNLIVAHEWGHYISNRLIGNSAGLNNTQGRGMGEGWGDFLAILTFVDEQDALIAGNEQFQGLYPTYGWVDDNAYFGIRRVPYTTNFALNALTFKHIEDGVALPNTHPIRGGATNSEVHNTGELWGNLMWEVYAGLINDNRYTFTQAQELMKEYIVASMKMTPVSPTFVDAKNALLSVARASNEADFDLILNVFARRGLGTDALANDRFSTSNSGISEGFSTSLLAFESSNPVLDASATGFCSDDNILDAGESAIIQVTITNNGFDPLTNVPVSISSPADVSFENGGTVNIASLDVNASTQVNFGVTLNSATVAEEIVFTIDFPDVDGVLEPSFETLSAVVNFSFGPDPSRDTEDMQNAALVKNDWSFSVNPALTADVGAAQNAIGLIAASRANSTQALLIEDTSFMSDISLVSPELNVGASNFTVSFDHLYDFETGSWDGGVIEVSEAGGAWQDVTSIAGVSFNTGYNGTITTNPDSPINARAAFVNNSNGLLNEGINFATVFANSSIRIRFRMGADAAAGGYGWEIDNVQFTGLSNNPFSMAVAESMPCDSMGANQAPVAAVASATVTVTEGDTVTLDATSSTDSDSDTLTYVWTQTSGPTVSLNNSTSATASFTAPSVTADTSLGFEVTVSDGALEDTAQVTVTVENQATVTPPAPTPSPAPSGGSGGGGSTGLISLLFLGLLFLRRKGNYHLKK